MAPSKTEGKLPTHNIPRTVAAAKRNGFNPKPRAIPIDKLPASKRKEWLMFSGTGKGAICGVRPLPSGGVEVCYIDPATGECNDCHRSNG
jgi:hypothetical protein